MKLTKEKEAQLVSLMQEYNASDIGDLMDILPDLDLEDEDEEEVDLGMVQELETAVLGYKEITCSYIPYPFNN